MSGRPAELLEPLAVEMRRHLLTNMHRAAPLTVHAGRGSYTIGMDKRVRLDSQSHDLGPSLVAHIMLTALYFVDIIVQRAQPHLLMIASTLPILPSLRF